MGAIVASVFSPLMWRLERGQGVVGSIVIEPKSVVNSNLRLSIPNLLARPTILSSTLKKSWGRTSPNMLCQSNGP